MVWLVLKPLLQSETSKPDSFLSSAVCTLLLKLFFEKSLLQLVENSKKVLKSPHDTLHLMICESFL